MRPKCEFGGCSTADRLVERVHLPSGSKHTYCEGHAPDVDADTWGEVDG